MNTDSARDSFETWLATHMRLGENVTPSRLIVLLAALERLRETPTLAVGDHLTPNGQQLIKHNKHVKQALARFAIDTPVAEYGRRASNVSAWIGPLFALLGEQGFAAIPETERHRLLEFMGAIAAGRVKSINEAEPLVARYSRGTARAVLVDLLNQAQMKNRAKDVAEYLVGAKLEMLYGGESVKRKDVNTPSEFGDFRVGNAAIEVTVNSVDSRHIEQVGRVLSNTSLDFWLFVRTRDRANWQKRIDASLSELSERRVVVTDIEGYLCANVTERGNFMSANVETAFAKLFEIYNERWLPRAGGGGIRIVSGNPETDAVN